MMNAFIFWGDATFIKFDLELHYPLGATMTSFDMIGLSAANSNSQKTTCFANHYSPFFSPLFIIEFLTSFAADTDQLYNYNCYQLKHNDNKTNNESDLIKEI